jgi:hypothetical protein
MRRALLVTCLFVHGCKASSTPPAPPPASPAPAPIAAPAPTPAVAPETWVGGVDLPGVRLDFAVRLEPDPARPGAWRGRIDIPTQGIKDYPLRDVDVTPDGLEFSLAPPGASESQHAVFVAEREPGAREAVGELSQSGQSFELKLRLLAPGEPVDLTPKRPQTPKPPFPYAVRDAAVVSPVDRVTLAGSFTAPAAAGKHPAVLLLTGSGAQDRDETILEHRPFAVLADHLTRAGVAVLRLDDRGIGGSGGRLSETGHDTLRRDAEAALTWLAAQPEVDPARVGLVGHSEGANVAMLTAAADRRVAFVVLLAGMGVTGEEILPMQMAALFRAQGAPEDALAKMVELEVRLLRAVKKSAPRPELEGLARELASLQLQHSKPPISPTSAQLDGLVRATIDTFTTEAMRSLLRHDPRVPLKKLRRPPVLALVGGLDLQVPAADNLARIDQALRAAGNKDVTLKTLPGLNHLFQRAKTGHIDEYADIEETLAPELLAEVTAWILARAAP